MSSNPSPSSRPDPDRIAQADDAGIGCKPFAIGLAVLVGFAATSVALGLWLALADNPSTAAERIGLALYVAGAPISGVFSAMVGQLPLAPFTDAIVWLVVAGLIARQSEKGRSLARLLTATIGIALLFGLVVSQAIERV